MNVIRQPIHDRRCLLDLADDRVAASAEHSANQAGDVIMVHDQEACGQPANETTPVLGSTHRFHLVRSEAVLAHKSGSQICGLRCRRIGCAPSTKASVTPSAVLNPVAAASFIGAGTTVRTEVLPGLREGVYREVSVAVCAPLRHVAIMPYQPCHADVLLELASGDHPFRVASGVGA
jgi:hypothetical protein